MISFMLGVLGSIMFWGIFIPIDFVIAIIVLRNFDAKVLRPFTQNKEIFNDEKDSWECITFCLFAIIAFMILWPAVILINIFGKMFGLVFPTFRLLLGGMINKIPNIKITTTKEDEK